MVFRDCISCQINYQEFFWIVLKFSVVFFTWSLMRHNHEIFTFRILNWNNRLVHPWSNFIKVRHDFSLYVRTHRNSNINTSRIIKFFTLRLYCVQLFTFAICYNRETRNGTLFAAVFSFTLLLEISAFFLLFCFSVIICFIRNKIKELYLINLSSGLYHKRIAASKLYEPR